MMTHLIMDHGVSGCFGTSLAPTSESVIEEVFLDFLIGECLHEAFLTTKESKRSNVHQFHSSQDFSSFACWEYVFCQLVLAAIIVLSDCIFVTSVKGLPLNLFCASSIFTLLCIMSLMTDYIGAQSMNGWMR